MDSKATGAFWGMVNRDLAKTLFIYSMNHFQASTLQFWNASLTSRYLTEALTKKIKRIAHWGETVLASFNLKYKTPFF